ncbi:SWIM zinc finger family protein [Streptomyces sp. Z26]|uniref:SWIM zinc finger family protein n=1 Tax=Streptomyces sp. Z26 TaxID=2500177 RepID=UPI000EF1564D|nr:SWIM zinc finger family protein [Streptomyces sp. Z26]RLL68526.1 SWIM zinc finger family protein [Streptomyces sp. Z26]
MTGQGARWTADQVMALAPDAASRKSGSKLAAPGPWSGAGAGAGAVWGLCKGSGKTAYRTVVDIEGEEGPGYKCSCPSRKFPCKHALGLLLLWSGGAEVVGAAPAVPDWAEEWLSGRRQRAEKRAAAGADGATGGGGKEPADPEAARRRAEKRHRSITAGAGELEQRLTDLLRGGLAGADQRGYAAWDETAARMVDAQARGLADRIRELGAIPASGPGWPERLLAECALLHLLAQGYLALDGPPEEDAVREGSAVRDGAASEPAGGVRPPLPEPLATTVRTRIGLTVDTAKLLADPEARQRDEWLVLAQRDTDEGKLTTRRIWLYGRRTRQPALLLSFGAAGRTPQQWLPVGASLDADLAFYPGSGRLRAALGEQHTPPVPGHEPVDAGGTVTDALAAYGAALCDDPWLDSWPVVLTNVVPVPVQPGPSWQLADADGDAALPVAPDCGQSALWRLLSLSGGAPLTVFGECGHQGFVPHTAWAPTAADGTAAPEAVLL